MSTQLNRAVDRMRYFFPHLPWTIRISHGTRSGSVGTGPERIVVKPLLDTKL